MAMTRPDTTTSRLRGGKPTGGHPVLFSLLLAVAALGTLILLVTGPSIALPLAVGGAVVLMGMVVLTWVIAGPRL